MNGGKLAGGNPENGRVEDDYYATNPLAVKMLLDNYKFYPKTILEPCVGSGNISNELNNYFNNEVDITGIDIVDRGYPNTIKADFLNFNSSNKYDAIISNPPYSLAGEFIQKSESMLSENGIMAMFLKIQFLEGLKRKDLFEKIPPKFIYVFRSRMATWNNGNEKDSNGKKWATTMCHAWFVWEKGFIGDPSIKWL